MEINIHDETKTVDIWLTKAESRDEALREKLKPLYKHYKQRKYFVAVFHSGNEDLLENTRYLLQKNLKEMAQNGTFQES